MKLYRIDFDEPGGDGWRVMWAGSHAEAAQKRAAIRAEYRPDPIVFRTSPVEVPTDKAGLLAWLNSHFNADGG